MQIGIYDWHWVRDCKMRLSQFPRAIGNLKQQKFIFSQFKRPEICLKRMYSQVPFLLGLGRWGEALTSGPCWHSLLTVLGLADATPQSIPLSHAVHPAVPFYRIHPNPVQPRVNLLHLQGLSVLL